MTDILKKKGSGLRHWNKFMRSSVSRIDFFHNNQVCGFFLYKTKRDTYSDRYSELADSSIAWIFISAVIMANPKPVRAIILCITLLSLVLVRTGASDTDPLQDFCVADHTSAGKILLLVFVASACLLFLFSKLNGNNVQSGFPV